MPLVLICVAAVLLIVVSNLRGLGDRVGRDGWELAALVGLSGAYVIASLALGIWHLRSR